MLIDRTSLIPSLRMNNRRINLDFFEKEFGLKILNEENAFVELGGHLGKKTRFMLTESPSMRTRAVVGTKKLNKLIFKIENPVEIEALLARGSSFTKLYRGKNGYAFEAHSPEDDTILIHAEENICDLQEVLSPETVATLEGFAGISDFIVEKIIINTPNPQASHDFYQKILPEQTILDFVEAQGEDLLATAEDTWDLDSLNFKVAEDMNWADLESKLVMPFFKDKKESFLQTVDPSGIELWFDK